MAKNHSRREKDLDGIVEIFAAVAPPFEDVAIEEFRDITDSKFDTAKQNGGYLFKMPLGQVKYLQPHLKIPTRLLLRLKEFRVRDLPKLYKTVTAMHWNDYLINGKYELTVDCKKSRLNNEKRVTACFEDALKTYFKAFEPRKSDDNYKHKIIVRFNDDNCIISLDLSGEPLYKRDLDKKIHAAPLRETLVHALFYPYKELVKGLNLIDPCCGSGSIARELLNWEKPMQREFALDHLDVPMQTMKLILNPLGLEEIYLNDKNQAALTVAKENLKRFGNVHYYNQDVAEFMTNKREGFLFANLPYGKQIPLKPALKEWMKLFNCQHNLVIYMPEVKVKTHGLKFYNGGIFVEAIKWEGSFNSSAES